MKPYNRIGPIEERAALAAMDGPLSGYLAGKSRGGKMVCHLEKRWQETFHVKHAIACNSATSGLLAASFAIGLKPGDEFICPAMTMSATAAAPMFTGAEPAFADVDEDIFGLAPSLTALSYKTRAVFITNLFGHPAPLHWWRRLADTHKFFLIEDNAQSPTAMSQGQFAGTIGHIGVFSLNVHKPIQCGEGGMITTNDDDLAERLRGFINHGENAGGPIGLNLRMPEVCAAIGLVQLDRAHGLLYERIYQAEEILAAIGDIPGIRPPVVRDGCTHVYYTIPFLIGRRRSEFCIGLRAEGVPIVEGYIDPLYRLSAFKRYEQDCPVAENLQDQSLFYFENCAWDLTREEIKKVGDAFKRVAEKLND